MITSYHAKYFANELTLMGGEGVDRLTRSLFDAAVDLNPHQIDAALFALRSPLSKGVLMADEVGLGKTIEAGLVLCQYWAERKRRILVICPAALRKQWEYELSEKFNLPVVVIDAKIYNQLKAAGTSEPFLVDKVIICSMHYAGAKAEEIRAGQWDMVVIDEAHKLRNAYRESNRIGQAIRWALEGRRKLLLTATPLQNSLLELYGLSTIIDENIFGDAGAFRTRYANAGGDLTGLRSRLKPFMTRTLRQTVQEYIRYTERRLITRPFKPTDDEYKLYQAISAFLQRPDAYALPKGQRHLLALLVRKVLASSAHAVAGTLEMMRDRLVTLQELVKKKAGVAGAIIRGEDIDDDLLQELLEDEEDISLELDEPEPEVQPMATAEPSPEPEIDLVRLEAEIAELNGYISWARGIGIDTKTRSLNTALEIGFKEMAKLGAASKAVIFTESCRSQEFLRNFLEANGYAGKVVTLNGSNKDENSVAIYKRWAEANKATGRATGSYQIDVRTAIIEQFRDGAAILIGTEAAAEGLNLQFCSLVVNFDLPWNPQRIEQRIGRCHRYGQKHDVIVINFLNERNAADQRVYELLTEKFKLFSGVFGASDDVIGQIETGMDFERRVFDIFQQCRSTAEIETAFQKLRAELEERITTRINETRTALLENFDEDVISRLKVNVSGAQERLDRVGKLFWALTQYALEHKATFDNKALTFNLTQPPHAAIPHGNYYLISKTHENIPGAYLYRMSHPLGEHVLKSGAATQTPLAQLNFDITHYPIRISVVEALKGKAGWLCLQKLTVKSFEQEEYLLFNGFDDAGKALDQETCQRLFSCEATLQPLATIDSAAKARLGQDTEQHAKAAISRSLEQNNKYFTEAREQLEKWAEDRIFATEKELKDVKEQIKGLERQARQAPNVQEQHDLQSKIKGLEVAKRKIRQHIFDAEDEITQKRNLLIDQLEKRMAQSTKTEQLFTIRWSVI